MSIVATVATSVLAVSWEPELRGLLTVIMGVVVLCGSLYLVLGTNLGARLGFLVALAGLAGWMVLMGILWWIYGIGLIGPDPSWEAVPGRAVIQDTDSLVQAGVLERRAPYDPDAPFAERAAVVRGELVAQGWEPLPESSPDFGQASAAAGTFLDETGVFGPGEFQVTALFELGGERYPKINDTLDFVAFWSHPKYALAEIAPLEELRLEPGRAPVQPEVDETRQRQYVYMIRDLGARRQPAAALTIGSGIVFLALCWMMHRRDRIVAENRSADLVPAG